MAHTCTQPMRPPGSRADPSNLAVTGKGNAKGATDGRPFGTRQWDMRAASAYSWTNQMGSSSTMSGSERSMGRASSSARGSYPSARTSTL
mgnify:CR=1 FL=1